MHLSLVVSRENVSRRGNCICISSGRGRHWEKKVRRDGASNVIRILHRWAVSHSNTNTWHAPSYMLWKFYVTTTWRTHDVTIKCEPISSGIRSSFSQIEASRHNIWKRLAAASFFSRLANLHCVATCRQFAKQCCCCCCCCCDSYYCGGVKFYFLELTELLWVRFL